MALNRLVWVITLAVACATVNAATVWSDGDAPSRTIPLPSAKTTFWARSDSTFRIRRDPSGDRFRLERNPTMLAPGERVLIGVRGWTLFRLGVTPTSAVGSIEVSELGSYTTLPLPDDLWLGAARIRVPARQGDDGFLYVRASAGSVFLYEARNAAPVPVRIVAETHELERDNLFWEVAERKAQQAATDGESWSLFLDELAKRNVSRDFIERQRTLLPWLSADPMTEAERSLRLASFYLDAFMERQSENRVFNDYVVEPKRQPHSVDMQDGTAYEASPDAPLEYRVEGPSLVEVETRFVYPNIVAEDAERYLVTVRRDGFVDNVFFYNASLDTLKGLLLDSEQRPLGRRLRGFIVVPPGSHTLAVESDRATLVRVTMRKKRSHVVDSLTNAEDPDALLDSALERTRGDAEALAERYVRAVALARLGRNDDARRIFDEVASNSVEPVFAAVVRLELARLDAEAGSNDAALSKLSNAQESLASVSADYAPRLARQIAIEKWRILRRLGRHADAALELSPVLDASPDDLSVRLRRADARAWALDPKALDDYDRVLDANPYDANAVAARQRFWFDAMYWKDVSPTVSPVGSRSFLDPFTMRIGFDDATRSTTDARRLPGLTEIAPGFAATIEVHPTRATKGLTVVCMSATGKPVNVLLRLNDGQDDVIIPIVRQVERFAIPLRPGVHTAMWSLPEGSSVRIFTDARLLTDSFVADRWDVRVYYPVAGVPTGTLQFPLYLDAGSVVRGLIRYADDVSVSSLDVRLDNRVSAHVEPDRSSGDAPLEFVLPVSGGFHRLDVTAHGGGVFICIMVRVTRTPPFTAVPLATGAPLADTLPWREPDSSRSDAAALAYREGVERLAADDRTSDENILIDAVAAFTRAIYMAAEDDSMRDDALVARGYALLRLSKPELSERDARRVLDNSHVPVEMRRRAEWLLASTLGRKGDEQQAIQLLVRLIANGLDALRIRLELARLYAGIGEREASLSLLEAIVAANPDHLGARRDLAHEYITEGRHDDGFALMERLEEASEMSYRRDALYVRALRALLEGDLTRGRELLDALRSDAVGSTPGESAARSFYDWMSVRIDSSIRLIHDWNTSFSDRSVLSREIAAFNEGWTRSPAFAWRASIERHFDERWTYVGDANVIRHGERWRAQDAFTGLPIGSVFPIDRKTSLTVRVVGPTWFRVDVRPALPVSDPSRATPPVRVEVAVFERDAMRARELIDEDTAATTIRFPDVPDVLPGRSTRVRLRVPAGEHIYTITSRSGVALVRPLELTPSPDALFLEEMGGTLRLVPSPHVPDGWYMRALAETPDDDLRGKTELMQIENLDGSAFEATLRALSEQGDGWASSRLGTIYADRGNVADAIRAFDRDPRPEARLEIARLKRLHAQSDDDLRDAVSAYDAYCSAVPGDHDAHEERGKLLLELGKRAKDIGERTFWFNRALLTFEPIAETHPERRDASLGRTEARQNTRWERLSVVENSATHLDIPGIESVPTLTTVRTESALTYQPWPAGSYADVGLSLDAIVSMTVSRPTRFRVKMFGQRPLAPVVPTSNYHVVVERNGTDLMTIRGRYDETTEMELGQFEPDVYHLRFRVEGADEYDVVHLRLYADRTLTIPSVASADGETAVTDSLTTSDGVWNLIHPIRGLRFLVGTSTTPIVVRVMGPTTLRLKFSEPSANVRVIVDRAHAKPLVTDVSASPPNDEATLVLSENGFQTVTFIPVERVAMRIYARVAKRAKSVVTVDPTVVSTVTPPKSPNPDPLEESFLESPLVEPLVTRGWGSLEASFGLGRNVEGAYSETFYPSYRVFGLDHRLRDESSRLYQRLSVAWREHRGRTPQYEITETLLARLPIQVTLTTRMRAVWQNVRGNLEKAGEFSFDGRRYDTLAPSLTLISFVGYNYAKSSLDDRLRVPTRFASQDIFSSYRRDHERNVVIEETAWYKPFLDVIAYARARTQTNRSLRPNDPDYVSGRVGARMYLWGLEAHTFYEIRRYFVDSDRKTARIDRRFSVDAEYGSWIWFGRRVNATLGYLHSKSADRDYIVVGLSAVFTGNRRLTDFTTAEEGFEAEKSYAGW
jgi:tetratricopeptide (TPR) repeat protein